MNMLWPTNLTKICETFSSYHICPLPFIMKFNNNIRRPTIHTIKFKYYTEPIWTLFKFPLKCNWKAKLLTVNIYLSIMSFSFITNVIQVVHCLKPFKPHLDTLLSKSIVSLCRDNIEKLWLKRLNTLLIPGVRNW